VPKPKTLSDQLKAFGANVRRERTAQGMTQEKLAELSDLALRNIQRVEAGEINILITTAARIRKALKCPWEKLMPPQW
jgi:transcriptional regulator with XRE-family HTH domain